MAEKALKPTEEKLKPKLFSVMKTYTKEQFVKDVISGIIVAIIALPLSIALALASGVGPDVQGTVVYFCIPQFPYGVAHYTYVHILQQA